MNNKKNQEREQGRNSRNPKNLDLPITQKQVFNSKNLEAKSTHRLESSLSPQDYGKKKLITRHKSLTLNYGHNRIIQCNNTS